MPELKQEYESFRALTTPSQDIRRKMDSCTSVTTERTVLLKKWYIEVDTKEFDAVAVKKSLLQLLHQIKWALESLRYYLLGREFDLETDHRALTWMNSMKDHNSRLTRWYLSLQPFQFQIRHRAGKTNVVADIANLEEEGDNVTGRR